MQLAIPMQFSKTTKRKTVYATGNDLVPTTNIYVTTEYLDSRGIETKSIDAIVSDVPFSDYETGRMLLSVPMRVSRKTKYKTVFAPVDADAPVDSLYVVSEWLHSHDFGDVLYLGISDAASGDEAEDGQNGDDAAAFDSFLDRAITRMPRSRLTTERIWSAWASCCDVSPDREAIEGIMRREVAQLFRERFSAPAALRGRVDGRVQYYWEGYAIVQGEEPVNVHREQAGEQPTHGVCGPIDGTRRNCPRPVYMPGGRGVTLS